MYRTRQTTNGFIVLASLLTVAACTDDIPVTSPERAAQEEAAEPAGLKNVVASVSCTANVTEGQLSCGKVPVVDEETGLQRVMLGGGYVQLYSPIVSYNPTTEIFQADVYVENLLPQGLGSATNVHMTNRHCAAAASRVRAQDKKKSLVTNADHRDDGKSLLNSRGVLPHTAHTGVSYLHRSLRCQTVRLTPRGSGRKRELRGGLGESDHFCVESAACSGLRTS